MKFKRLEIRNFKAIQNLVIEDLEDTVLIVGPNGVGKSCIFDAIRLIKSSYGGYQPNEWKNWFNELKIQVGQDFLGIEKVLRDKSVPLHVSCSLELAAEEIEYLKSNGEKLIREAYWREHGGFQNENSNSARSIGKVYRENEAKIEEAINKELSLMAQQIEQNVFNGSASFFYGKIPAFDIQENSILSTLFSTYTPENLGIIDYHGANRVYQQENLNNLNIKFNDDNSYRSSVLYNYANKYNNVKTELASSYIKALIAMRSGVGEDAISSLNSTLQELFSRFFPGKKFGGVQPSKDGTLSFPVELSSGLEHDIADLSSGEKEVLFGYLRLWNQAPKNSVILIDEPELHLNPALAKDLPEFYHETIGAKLNNQIWLVTHSDAILKKTIGLQGFSIYQMIDPNNQKVGENQVQRISQKNVEAALIELIGDFSSYHKYKKVVIFEGINSNFDREMTCDLFPEFGRQVNTISAGAKTNVKNLQTVLRTAVEEGIIDKEFISIVDKDLEEKVPDLETREFFWDAYHIENYLLEEEIILAVIGDGLRKKIESLDTQEKIVEELKLLAKEEMANLVRHQLHQYVHGQIHDCISLKVGKNSKLAEGYLDAAMNVSKAIKDRLSSELTIGKLRKKELQVKNDLTRSLKDGTWKKHFRGRDILTAFSAKHLKGIDYENFRNLIISEMKRRDYRPSGMKEVIEKILNL